MSFDSRGRGAAPSEWCRVLVVARYWCGAHGRFDAQLGRLLPAPAAVEGPRGVLPPVVAAPTPGLRATPGGVARPLLKNEADPVYDLLGPGRVSHPQEWNETITRLKQEGVRVVFRAGAWPTLLILCRASRGSLLSTRRLLLARYAMRPSTMPMTRHSGSRARQLFTKIHFYGGAWNMLLTCER